MNKNELKIRKSFSIPNRERQEHAPAVAPVVCSFTKHNINY